MLHPEAKVTIEMYESGQVLPRLAKGEMQIGLMSRPLTEQELKDGGVVAIRHGQGRAGHRRASGQSARVAHARAGRATAARSARRRAARRHDVGRARRRRRVGQARRSRSTAAAPARAPGATWSIASWARAPRSRTATDCSGYAEICKSRGEGPRRRRLREPVAGAAGGRARCCRCC